MTDDSYLLKLKQMGWPEEKIAAKLGLTVAQVKERWKSIEETFSLPMENGIAELRQVGLVMANQFQLLGQSLGIFSHAAYDSMNVGKLREIIKAAPPDADLAAWILSRSIVLNPFILPSPEELAKALEPAPTPTLN